MGFWTGFKTGWLATYYFNLSIEIQKNCLINQYGWLFTDIGSSCQFVCKEIYNFQKRSMITEKWFGTFGTFCQDYSDNSDYPETCDCRLIKNLTFTIYCTVQKMLQPSSINYRGEGLF